MPMTLRSLLALIAACWLALATPATAQTFPPLTGRVVDAARLLDPAQVAQLTQLSADIEKASGRQFVVATIPDLQDYPIEDYGYRLGRAWKIGQGEANNGIILIVAPNARKVRIEVGYGLEPVMTDALSGIIIRDTILPKFRDGDMAGGIMAGAAAIGEQMKLPLEAAEARAKQQLDAAAATQSKRRNNGGGSWVMGLFWLVILLFFVVPMLRGGSRGRRYRRGGMPVVIWGPDAGSSWGSGGSSWGSGGGSSWGGGDGSGGGFSGGGGSFGGGGASGGW